MTAAALLYAASGLAVVSGVAMATRTREHRPVAGILAYGLAADLVARALRPAEGWSHPLEGLPRVGFHVAEVLLAGYPIAVLAGTVVVLRNDGGPASASPPAASWGVVPIPSRVSPKSAHDRRLTQPLAAGATLYLSALVVGYHPLSLWDGRLSHVYAVTQTVVVLGLLAVAARWWRALSLPRRAPTASEVVALWLGGVEVVNLAGPYLLGLSHWQTMAWAAYALSYVVVTLIQGATAWSLRRSAG